MGGVEEVGRVERPVVVFDGVCNLCNASIDFLLRHDRRGVFRFASNQSGAGRKLLSERGVDPENVQSVYLVEADGRVSSKSTAVLRIARELGWPWRLATVFRVVPRPVRDVVYDLVARSRYRLFGRRQTCRLPKPEERARFLEDEAEVLSPRES